MIDFGTPGEIWTKGAEDGQAYAEQIVALLRSDICKSLPRDMRTTIIAGSCCAFLGDKRANLLETGCTETEANIFAAAAHAVMMDYFKAFSTRA